MRRVLTKVARIALSVLSGGGLAACGAGQPSESIEFQIRSDGGVPSPDPTGEAGASSTEDAGAAGDSSELPPVFSASEWTAVLALSPVTLPGPVPDPTNRFADVAAAAALGQRLFFDPSFSGPLLDADNDGSTHALGNVGQTGKVACAGCHLPSSGFSDTRSFQRQISLGAGWGRRRAPSLLDVGQSTLLMWDGRRDSMFSQVFGPLESVVEMNSSRLYLAERIFQQYKSSYESIFGPLPSMDDAAKFPPVAAAVTGCQPKAPTDPQPKCDGVFHGMPGDRAEYDSMSPDLQTAVTRVVVNVGKAIGAYERLLTCGQGPFDAFVHGSAGAISPAAQRGAQLFVGKAQCVSCHSGPFLSDQKFHNVGLSPQVVQQAFVDQDDPGASQGLLAVSTDPLDSAGQFSDGTDGRLAAGANEHLLGGFRTPMLRCVSQRPTFMHTGQLVSLDDVVSFFNRGGDPSGFPGANELRPLGLTPGEESDLTSFLEALLGPGADPKYRAAATSGP